MALRIVSFKKALLIMGFAASLPCLAQQSHATGDQSGLERNGLEAALSRASDIADRGNWDLYLSGYAHHSRDTYSHKRLQKLNERAWGIGLGKTIRNEQGNDESLYALVIRDSNRNHQWSAGYAYQWIFPVGSTGLEAGAGVSAGLIQRKDWFNGVPFPAVLPMFSLGRGSFKLMGTYVPHMSTRKGKGDVLFLFVKYTF